MTDIILNTFTGFDKNQDDVHCQTYSFSLSAIVLFVVDHTDINKIDQKHLQYAFQERLGDFYLSLNL